MIYAALLILLVMIAVALRFTASAVVRSVRPAVATRLLLTSSLTVAAATGFVLSVTAFSALGQDASVAGVGHWSSYALRNLAQLPIPMGFAAGIVFLSLVVSTLRRVTLSLRSLWSADRVCGTLRHHVSQVVVIDDDAPQAYALQGIRGRVVVSTGMLAVLSPGEARAMFAHERSHLRHRHSLYVVLSRVAAAANPLLSPVTDAVVEAVERWADEDAATVTGDRATAARAVARAALATAQAPDRRDGTPALAIAEGQCVFRTRALLAPPLRSHRAIAGFLVAATVVATASAVVAERFTEHNFEQARNDATVGTVAR